MKYANYSKVPQSVYDDYDRVYNKTDRIYLCDYSLSDAIEDYRRQLPFEYLHQHIIPELKALGYLDTNKFILK